VALTVPPYTWRKGGGPRKATSGYKWLIPLLAYGQVRERRWGGGGCLV